ncbi:MAG: hypothetical protein U9N86_06965 [Bacteroidota bacterium]|nr:hypothetical protein [Bacteroidota bacterium]
MTIVKGVFLHSNLRINVIIDLYDRKVVGWAMSEGLTAAETIVVAWS